MRKCINLSPCTLHLYKEYVYFIYFFVSYTMGQIAGQCVPLFFLLSSLLGDFLRSATEAHERQMFSSIRHFSILRTLGRT